MTRHILIDPITRIEGHGKIDIALDSHGKVSDARFQVPEFRGFEKFCEGRAAEEMPILTQKICGVCPTAHHIASTKALDDLFNVSPPLAAQKIRELIYHAFMFEDHLLHVYYLGGPDWLLGPDVPALQRNILGLADRMGKPFTSMMMAARNKSREIIARTSGSALYPVFGLPGGIAKSLNAEDLNFALSASDDMVAFARMSLDLFKKLLLKKSVLAEMMTDPLYYQPTYYLGMVDDAGRLSFYDGRIRVMDPTGTIHSTFEARDFSRHLVERVEPWTYMKTLALKDAGRDGFSGNEPDGIYRVGPLARLNVSSGISTPLAHAEYENMMNYFGIKPVHHTMAYHWARLIEVLYAAERTAELAGDSNILSAEIRNLPKPMLTEQSGTGACEAPRGTLFHDYRANSRAMILKLNLVVATQHNAAAICRSVYQAASRLISDGRVSERITNRIEMAYRAYDPCLACATH
ncbi:MAG: Ni/Fe hydrogenase subunit alpha [Deltaproteobacteria bacterium]|nr:Ni/Fe hydrogenase subunit alpha [Deltaproteobacteria bacterium]